MGDPYAGKQSCWTCRLRKKKCDQGRPQCSACESLSITCHGYGPKPDWMNNGDTVRAVTNSLKQTVKHTSRRKPTTHFRTQRKPIITLAPKPSKSPIKTFTPSSESSHLHDTCRLSDHGSSQEGLDILQDEKSSPSTGSDRHPSFVFNISVEDSVLLMHFLDKIFPLQYPMYTPGILEGGRGWLLTLLLRTKPLYYAALALSSYHRLMMITTIVRPQCRVVAVAQQGKHLETCLVELQQAMKSVTQFIQNSRSNNGLGTITSIVQLVFYELFAGQGSIWQTHLRAATDMYDRVCRDKLARLSLTENSRAILCEDLPLSGGGAEISQEVVSFRFMGGTIIWLDITASITAGIAPKLLSYHSGVIASNSQTKLEDIMGCKNWVMIQIGRIAALHEHRKRAIQIGLFDYADFDKTAKTIGKEMEFGLAREALESLNISEGNFPELSDTAAGQTTLVTQIFAYMASVYLHLVTHGFQRLEILNTTISGAVSMLQTQTPTHLLPAVVSPLYMIGCVARQGDEQQFFRNICSSRPFLDPLLEHRGRILPILEEVWNRRQMIPSFAWDDSLELTRDLLLV